MGSLGGQPPQGVPGQAGTQQRGGYPREYAAGHPTTTPNLQPGQPYDYQPRPTEGSPIQGAILPVAGALPPHMGGTKPPVNAIAIEGPIAGATTPNQQPAIGQPTKPQEQKQPDTWDPYPDDEDEIAGDL